MVTVSFLLVVVVFAVSWRGVDTVYDWYSRTSTLEWRFELWRDTLAIVRDFRWFGTGLNTYGVSTLVYPMSDPTRHVMEAHSDYVQILSEGGIVLAVAALFAIVQLSRAIRAGSRNPRPLLFTGCEPVHAGVDRDGDSGIDRLQPADAGKRRAVRAPRRHRHASAAAATNAPR
jgi:O-antigen ligase